MRGVTRFDEPLTYILTYFSSTVHPCSYCICKIYANAYIYTTCTKGVQIVFRMYSTF